VPPHGKWLLCGCRRGGSRMFGRSCRDLRRLVGGCWCLVTAIGLAACAGGSKDMTLGVGSAGSTTLQVLQMNLCDSGIAGCYTGRSVAQAAAVIRSARRRPATVSGHCHVWWTLPGPGPGRHRKACLALRARDRPLLRVHHPPIQYQPGSRDQPVPLPPGHSDTDGPDAEPTGASDPWSGPQPPRSRLTECAVLHAARFRARRRRRQARRRGERFAERDVQQVDQHARHN